MELSMKSFLIRLTIATLLCVANLTGTKAQTPPDFQKIADDAKWPDFEKLKSLHDCLTGELLDYQIQLTRPKSRSDFLRIRILDDGGNEVYAWDGDPNTPFIGRDGILYHALPSRGSSGCEIVAYDLKQKKLLWKTQLQSIGVVDHSAYSNEVRFGLLWRNEAALVVVGRESAGRYIEIVDLKTGKTVGHKKYPEEEEKAP
jgi:hypothetical protein